MLTVTDHRRDYSGFRYAYPVVSRRVGGVSVGINLNPNNACNWACIYCQVPDLTRGGPPPIDLGQMQAELEALLGDVVHGDFMQREVPEGARQLMDVAFSGNGEPTSAAEFPAAVAIVVATMHRFNLLPATRLRLITNGSLLHRQAVQDGIRGIGAVDGEIWFKIDRGTAAGFETINRIGVDPARALAALDRCATLAPTWVQTCWFALDGRAPGDAEESAYVELLRPVAEKIKGVHLYGLARPSLQPDAPRLGRLPEQEMAAFAARISALGVEVSLNP
ncbi:MAG TPA: radical SAM protein [Azospira sp.]|nr:radical SAM protein [Azospira sp.]HNN46325.1 radical SAM protein [Azospira sp.]